MCGIVGFFKKNILESDSSISSLCNVLNKRGPDSAGYYVNDNLHLGHRRLSIIDISTGDQPMHSHDNKCVIVFNGEIYNFLSLRYKLSANGYPFKTKSDTEVVLATYQTYGISKTLELLEGMFAFALFDKTSNKLYIARDKFGEKPLYYYKDGEAIYFASELKAIEPVIKDKTISLVALNLFLSLTYIPSPYTIYESVKKLEAGNYITIDTLTGSLSFTTYYDIKNRYNSLEPITDYSIAKKELRELLFHSVEQRMISDVPLGAFLSGGIDSSIVSAIMAKLSPRPINTFSIGFREKQYDESERAALVANHIKSNHNIRFLNHYDILNVVDEVLEYFDEPFADSSALPSHFVAKAAREHVKVALTGDAADELFGGYEKYLGPLYAKRFQQMPKLIQRIISKGIKTIPQTSITNHFLRKANKVIDNASLTEFDLHYNLMCLGLSDDIRYSLLGEKAFKDIKPLIQEKFESITTFDPMVRGFFTDLKVVLEGDMLTKVDRMGMYNSLEARVPFLDSKIVEFAYRIPTEFKIKGSNKKLILKETFNDLLPGKIFRFGKKGFGVPINQWFKNELRSSLEEVLSTKSLELHGFFNIKVVKNMINEHLSNKKNNSSQLWSLFVFQKWYLKRFNDNQI